jgi:hypothetical protein
MRKCFATLCALVIVSVFAVPSYGQQGTAPAAKKPSAPAPRRDISGYWLGNVIPRKQPAPPMTPAAQEFFNQAKPMSGPRAEPIAKTNDPFVMCDPMGIPRGTVYETRGIAFEHVPRKTLELFQYGKIWREIWTDGRKLPTNVGAPGANTSDPRYYGYSVGEWADDYTFVVRTTGFNEDVWATELGHPRSMNAMVEERYRRVDHDNLEVTVTITDPKSYTSPFTIMKEVYTWAPTQEFEEQLCIPSEAIAYRETFREAGEDK